jgi:hypothetical protein
MEIDHHVHKKSDVNQAVEEEEDTKDNAIGFNESNFIGGDKCRVHEQEEHK